MDVDQLIIENMDYVENIAGKLYKFVADDKKGLVTMDDLISAGHEGLIKAAQNYDDRNTKAKFTTYAYHWIRGEMIRELIFYVGKSALLFNEEELKKLPTRRGIPGETMGYQNLGDIPQEKQVAIITAKLKEFGLTHEEIYAFLAVKGVGRAKVTNMKILSREIGKSEFQIRRILQRAEEKVKKAKYE